jgi:hypothetical protein
LFEFSEDYGDWDSRFIFNGETNLFCKVWRIDVNMLNKHSWIASRGWFSGLGVRRMVKSLWKATDQPTDLSPEHNACRRNFIACTDCMDCGFGVHFSSAVQIALFQICVLQCHPPSVK